QEGRRRLSSHSKRPRLGVARQVTLLERDLQRSLVEPRQVRSCVVHEDVQSAQCTLDLIEHAVDVLRTRYVGLYRDPFDSPFPDLRQRVRGCLLVLVIVDGHLHAMLRKLQCDASPDATRASRDQGTFSLERHAKPPSASALAAMERDALEQRPPWALLS